MNRFTLSSKRERNPSIHLQIYQTPEKWVTIQYLDPYAFLKGLPVGMLYIMNSPPGLGRSSIIHTLSSIHDYLVEPEHQIWLSKPAFPYLKDSLILEFDLMVKKVGNPFDLPARVKIGVNRFLTRYGKLLNLSEGYVETVRERLVNASWKLAISYLMVQGDPLSCMFN